MGKWRGNNLKLGSIVGSDRKELVVTPDDRALHTYVVGTTGAGKSSFLQSLIQQDIANWPESRAGLLFIDPDGLTFDNVMGWAEDRDFLVKRPILPIDFRRDDHVVAYNPLRPRTDVDSQVVADNLAIAIANVWGDASLDETPRFSRFARSFLHGLYLLGATLPEGDAFLEFAQARIRQAMAQRIDDARTRAVWDEVIRAKEREFLEKLESTQNRFDPILSNAALRAMLGQRGESLDLRKAADEGYIILACVSQAGGHLSEMAQKSFVALLLADLWQTMEQRGKGKSEKPFYAYVDEFHEFVSPVMAKALPKARGFGLHFTLAHQFLGQVRFTRHPEVGERVVAEITHNAQTIVAFGQRDEAEIDRLTRHLFSATFDPMKVKHVITSTKAVGIEKVVLSSWSESESSADSTEVSGGGEVLDAEGNVTGVSSFMSSSTPGLSSSRSSGQHEAYIPVYGQEVSSVEFSSLDEQVFAASAAIRTAPKRHAVVKRPDDPVPTNIRTLTVADDYPAKLRERFYQKLVAHWPFVVARQEAERVLAERTSTINERVRAEEDVEHELPPPPLLRARVIESAHGKQDRG